MSPINGWPNSVLKIESCVGVNEIVNAPWKLVSTHPYLVAPPEIIRPRYLIITGNGFSPPKYIPPKNFERRQGYLFPTLRSKADVKLVKQQLNRGIGKGTCGEQDLTNHYLDDFNFTRQDRNEGLEGLRPHSLKKDLIDLARGRKRRN